MRVLLLTPHYLPEIRSVSVLMSQLADDLAAAGHTVTVLTPYPPANMAEVEAVSVPAREARNGVRVLRIQVLPFVKVAPVVRALTHFTLAGAMAAAGLREGRHDVMIAYSPPLTLALACEILGRWWRAPYVLNVQDVYPQTLIDLGLARNRVVVAVLRWLERRAYRHAAAITVHSEGNHTLVAARGVPDGKITVVHNWIDTTETAPGPRDNQYRAEFGLRDAFVVLFAGVMGYAQDLAVIVEAASQLRDERDVVFLLVGDGVRRQEAEGLVRARGLQNVRFAPFQPVERYPLLLNAADCCLATLQASVATPVVPSKIAGILAAARPVVAAFPEGDARGLVEASGGGVCVAPGDAAALAAAIRRLARDPALGRSMGQAGRAYVEAHYSRSSATGAYDRLITDVVKRTRPTAGDSLERG
ncbi:MAG TPA: glycosyltransferase family 4 protein [bacterium]|nr:glycosyltransferase family 4 protein [bacterium]